MGVLIVLLVASLVNSVCVSTVFKKRRTVLYVYVFGIKSQRRFHPKYVIILYFPLRNEEHKQTQFILHTIYKLKSFLP
jgi:hypothetical protein